MPDRHRQSGISFWSFLFFAVVVLTVALIGFRVGPSYIEYFTVEKILRQMMAEGKDMTLAEARRNFDRRAGVDYVDSVRGSDIELTKSGNEITISASWQTTLHLVGNVSLLLDFNASATK